MFLLAGLGNPGEKYKKTRHNAGFLASETFAEARALGKFSLDKKFNALILKGEISGKKIVAVMPQTFMNNSGEAVAAAARYFKIPAKNIIILHDELDLDFGRIKLSRGSGPAGHNGVKSIIEHLGTKDFIRLRIGVKNASAKKLPSEDFVLKNFSAAELAKLSDILNRCSRGIELLIKEGAEAAMCEVNRN